MPRARLLHHAPSNLPSTHSPDAKGWESPLEGMGRKKSQPKSPRRGRMPPWRSRPAGAGDAEMLDVGTRKNALFGTEVQVDVLERARQPGLTVVKSQSPAPDRVVVAPLACCVLVVSKLTDMCLSATREHPQVLCMVFPFHSMQIAGTALAGGFPKHKLSLPVELSGAFSRSLTR